MVQQLDTNTFGCAKWIVDANATKGTHTTIAGALTSASSGDTIFVRPGTYTENLTLKAGVNITAYECDPFTPNVTILGKCTATFAGTATLSGLRLKTNGDYCVEATGSNATLLNFRDCFLDLNNFSGVHVTVSNSSSRIVFTNCDGDMGTTGIAYFVYSGTGNLTFTSCNLRNTPASTTNSTIDSGQVQFFYCLLENAITFSTIGSGSLDAIWCTLDSKGNQPIVVNKNATAIKNCNITSGSGVPISSPNGTVFLHNNVINSSNANISSGAGTTVFSLNMASGGTSPGTYGTTGASATIVRAGAISATNFINSYLATSQTLPASSTLDLNTISTNSQWMYTASSQSDSTYRCMAMIWAFTGTTVIVSNVTSNNMTFTNSGLTIRLSNSTGSSKTVDISAIRLR